MDDPGTIYSDDDIENFSDDDSEDELQDNATNDSTTKKISSIEKYMDINKTGFDVEGTIQRVLEEENEKGNLVKEIDYSLGFDDRQIEFKCKETNLKQEDKNAKKRLRRKERKEESLANSLEKDKEELGFEDAVVVDSGISFDDMNLSIHILRAIAFMGYSKPTPIQTAAIPLALKGRDIFGCAATGTGKTAAFMLPIIQRLIYKPSLAEDITRVLIMVPTRELGVQVFEVAQDAAKFTEISITLSVGGLDRSTQSKELLKHPDIIIATPGRLIDHMHNTIGFSLRDIEILVLDEADRMLDDFFVEQLTEIVQQCGTTRQTMLFSATMSEKIKDLVVVSLKRPVRVFINNNKAVAENLNQEFIRLKKPYQTEESRLAVLAYLLVNYNNEETIVFMQHKQECHRLRILFRLLGLPCGELHADLKQNQRLINLHKFKKKEIKILFATDIAARGLDIKGVKKVINYNVPYSYQIYVHRVGRTARAGKSGRSVTISFDSGKDFSMLRQIQKDSYTPLYERVIDSKHIEAFMQKINELDPLLDKVIHREKLDKMYGGNSSLKDKKKKKLSKENEKDKKVTRKEVQEKIKKLEEKIKKLNRGILPDDKPKKKNIPKVTSKPLKNFKNKKHVNQNQNKKPEKNRGPNKNGNYKKSYLGKETNQKNKNEKSKEFWDSKKNEKMKKSFFDKDINIGNFRRKTKK